MAKDLVQIGMHNSA